MVEYKDGKIFFWKGVIACVPDRLKWVFFDKKNNKGVPIRGNGRELARFVNYGSPLTERQVKKLMLPYGRRDSGT